MSSGKSQQQQQHTQPSNGPVVRCGHLRKCGSLISGLKPLKKKYFVLRGDTPGHAACLEYYDNKKKYENKHPPKRTITMRSCYNINRRTDTKHKHVIALYTKDECFSLILDNDKEVSEWLTAMLLLSDDVPDGEEPRPTYEHMWQVTLQKKGLGERKNLYGPYRLCLTDRVLSLIKLGVEDTTDRLEFPLTTIRRCGCMDRIFYMEVGRSAITGEGDYWMKAEDSNIAQNMHAAILNAMSGSSNKDKDKDRDNDMVPKQRLRSSSANEASKPISVLGGRRPTGHKLHGFSPLEEQRDHKDECGPLRELQNITASAPSQCCSQSQICSSSTNTLTAVAGTRSLGTYAMGVNATANRRRHSVASQPPTIITNKSQSIIVTTALTTTTTNNNYVINAASTTTTSSSTSSSTTTTINNTINKTNTTKSHHQRTLSLPLAAVVINQTQSSKRSVLRCPTARDRCDSLPSRARTISDGLPAPIILSHSRTAHLAPQSSARPHSMYTRGLSYSPPISSMPISPASGACSTDSAGSSLSMDDGTDSMLEESTTARYGHSLTPDEPVILEENVDDYVPWSSSHVPLKYSPNFKSHSPSQQSSYVEMYSPCGSSPGRGYLPMSPATTVHSHSRTSSLVEEATLPDGYVPMAPVGDDGYVDMDPTNNHDSHYNDEISQHGSSCSVTSGTPSTDHRFTEYSLDKVSSFLTPSDDTPARPTRAYSVGSRPEPTNRHRKNRLDITQQETNRVRAFSVGSRSKRPEFGRLANVITARLPIGSDNVVNTNKSNSAPLLSSSWGHNSALSITSERMEDLMEMDFTNRSNVIRTTLSSTPSSYSQSHSYSTATDISSYVDMSPGRPHASNTPYVNMSGMNKVNRNNNNNNITANHNHNQVNATTNVTIVSHKPVTKPLKPVVETEGYLKMNNTIDDGLRQDTSPKQQYGVSLMQEDYMQMSGPPGVMRTAPVDLPQPRKPPEGYVEMTFKGRSNSDQNYINMTIGNNNSTRNRRRQRPNSRKEKSQRSQPIAIQATNKQTKTPSFLPLNGSSTSESLASTPASPPHATPTGSNSTIFPFSLNSPQSPIKPFTLASDSDKTITSPIPPPPPPLPPLPTSTSSDYLPNDDGYYAVMTRESPSLSQSLTSSTTTAFNSKKEIKMNDRSTSPLSVITATKSTMPHQQQETNSTFTQTPSSPLSPLSKRLNDLSVTKKKVTCHTTMSPITIISTSSSSTLSSKDDELNLTKLITNETSTTKSLKRERECDKPSSPINRESKNGTSKGSQTELPQSPVTKKLSEFSVSKTKFIGTTSPNTSPTPMAGLKVITPTSTKIASKILDDNTTPIVTPTPTPSPMDSEGYEKLQPGATLLHYASLDLPESTSVPPVSPTPIQDGFRYAEIDFAKLKQN